MTLAVLVALFVLVFPTRLYLDQRREISDKKERLEQLDNDVALLLETIEQLNDPEIISEMAREQHLLVPEGAEVFVIQEPAPVQIGFPEEWPWSGFTHLVNGN